MMEKNHHLKIELSPRDRKFTLAVGLAVLLTGIGTMTSNWPLASFAPLAVMAGMFLTCLVALVSLKKTA